MKRFDSNYVAEVLAGLHEQGIPARVEHRNYGMELVLVVDGVGALKAQASNGVVNSGVMIKAAVQSFGSLLIVSDALKRISNGS